MTDFAATKRESRGLTRNRIAERREELGLTKTDVARLVGTSKQHYGRLESGETGLDMQWLTKIAKALVCRPIDLRPDLAQGSDRAHLVGYVGAGEKIFNFDDGALEEIDAPPGMNAAHVVRVKGDSMWPAYREGDYLFFAPADALNEQACLYRDCVVQVFDGPTYVKRILPGPSQGVYTLASYRASEITDVRVRWASPVLWVKRH